jgi:hypothetical protein
MEKSICLLLFSAANDFLRSRTELMFLAKNLENFGLPVSGAGASGLFDPDG